MRTYSQAELTVFLKAIDLFLERTYELIVIGGTAAAVGYRATRYTNDIDTTHSTKEIEEAYRKAVEHTGLHIPLGPAPVFDAPYDYETRLKDMPIEGLTRLRVRVPEKHDLVLMKVMRGYVHDLEAAVQIHANDPLSYDVMLDRMLREMTHVHGDQRMIRQNFLAMVEAVFGEEMASNAEKALGKNH